MVLASGFVLGVTRTAGHHLVVLGSEVKIVQLVEVSVIHDQLYTVLNTRETTSRNGQPARKVLKVYIRATRRGLFQLAWVSRCEEVDSALER